MNIFNKTIFSLLLSISIPAFGMQNALLVKVASRAVETGKSLGKISSEILTALAINSALEYISIYAGLHGGGIASRDQKYAVTIPRPTNLSQLISPKGWLAYNKTNEIATCLARPLIKTSTTIAQIAGLEIIHRSIGKSPSWANSVLATLKLARVSSVVLKTTEGFLPTYFNENDGNGNGHKIWKWLTGNDKFPAICDKYYLLSLATMLLSLYISTRWL